MTFKPVRKAIFPVGGLGARILPAPKAIPKELLPIVDPTLIHYEVQEAQAAVVQIIRTLEQSGEIVLRRGGDDELVG